MPPLLTAEEDILYEVQPDSIPGAFDISAADYIKAGERDLSVGRSLRLAHISDIHHYASSLYDEDSPVFERFSYNNEGRTVLYTAEILEGLKAELLQREIDILLVSGDLSVLGAKATHQEVARIFKNYERSGIRVLLTTGNHDINNPRAFRITYEGTENTDSVSPAEFRGIYKRFGFEEAVLEHDESLSYLTELEPGFMLLALDTSYYQDNYRYNHSAAQGIIIPSLYDFAADALEYAEEHGADVIVMSHHNFLEHYEIDFDLSNFMVNDEGKMLRMLEAAGVHLALSGHIHKSDIKQNGPGSDFYSAAVTAFSQYPHSYRLIGLDAEGAGINEFNLNTGLDKESRHEILTNSWYIYYRRNFLEQYLRLLDKHSEAQAFDMAEYFFLANLYSQQGLEDYLPEYIEESTGAKLFIISDSFMKGFAAALPLDSPPMDRNVELKW